MVSNQKILILADLITILTIYNYFKASKTCRNGEKILSLDNNYEIMLKSTKPICIISYLLLDICYLGVINYAKTDSKHIVKCLSLDNHNSLSIMLIYNFHTF